MARIIDITGRIHNGMWNYAPPFPKVAIRPLPQPEWVDDRVYCEVFDGLHSQTGTYLETPAHFFGNDASELIQDVEVASLYRMPCAIIRVAPRARAISADDLELASGGDIKGGESIIVATGWDAYWRDDNFLGESPYFTRGAVEWMIEKRPPLIASDFPRWDNLDSPQGFFKTFYEAGILMLAPVVNVFAAPARRALLTALPINIEGTSCAPCRAVLEVDDDE